MSVWTDISQFVSAQILPKDIVNTIISNLEFLRTPPRYFYQRSFADADYTTTSVSLVLIDATNLSTTFTTYGNPVRMRLSGNLRHSGSSGQVTFEFLVDGSPLSNAVLETIVPGTVGAPIHIERLIPLSAGSHTFSVQWAVSGGTATLERDSAIQFEVNEEY